MTGLPLRTLAICRLAAALLSAFPLLGAQTATFPLSGKVVRDSDHHPIPRAHVFISPVGHPDRAVSCVTGENGDFSFSGLPAGKYSLGVESHGAVQLYQELDEYSTAIAVGPGLESEHIVFPFQAAASIAGSVLDEDGDPVRGGAVYLFGQSLFRGRYQTGIKSVTSTGTDGTFHFSHLPPGTYYVAVSGRPWYAQNDASQMGAAEDQPAPPSEPRSELDVAYPLTYYPGATSYEAATPIKLAVGARVEVQFNLHPVPALHISLDGVETQPDQQIGASLAQIGPGGTLVSVPVSPSNSRLVGVAPGEYVLTANLSGPKQAQEFGSQPVSLNSDSTVHVGDAVRTSVSGKVIVDGDIPQGLAVLLKNVANGTDAPAFVASDGSFSLGQPLAPGRYTLILANTPDLYIRAMTVKGGSYSNAELSVAKGAQVELTIAAARGMSKVEGLALNGKKPVAGAMVLLLPQDLSHGGYIPRDQSDSDGTFTLNWAAPGRYTLVAVDDGRDLEYANPAAMTPYLQGGRVLDLPLSSQGAIEIQVQPRQ